MTTINNPNNKLEYRPATPEDAHLASRLLFDTSPKEAIYIYGFGDARRAKLFFKNIFSLQAHRYSYQLAEMVTIAAKPVGMIFAYPGHMLNRLNWRFSKLVLKPLAFKEKLRSIMLRLPMVFIQEAAKDQFFISNIGLVKSQRGVGLGAQILTHIEEKARAEDFTELVLMVDLYNKKARHFYETHGFKVKAIHLESKQRAKYLGTGYAQMVKSLHKA